MTTGQSVRSAQLAKSAASSATSATDQSAQSLTAAAILLDATLQRRLHSIANLLWSCSRTK